MKDTVSRTTSGGAEDQKLHDQRHDGADGVITAPEPPSMERLVFFSDAVFAI